MRNLLGTLILWLLWISYAKSQNLVPNSSFEDTISCPTSISQFNKVQFWVNPTQASPDYFNACDPNPYNANVPYTAFGFQNARTGSGIAGFYTGGPCLSPSGAREYIQIAFTNTLTAGKEYYTSFYVNLSDWARFATSKIGAYISASAPTRSDMLNINATPQIENTQGFVTDTLNWTLISGTYTAQGGEKYITIGNFYDEINTDTLNMGLGSSGFSCHYYFIDDVSVIDVESLGISPEIEKALKVYPVPCSTLLNIETRLYGIGKLVDILGKEIKTFSVEGDQTVNVVDLLPGVYFLHLNTEKGNFTRKIIVQR